MRTKKTIEVKFDPSAGYWTMNPGNGTFYGPPYPDLVVPYRDKGEFTFKIVQTPGAEFGNPAFVRKNGKPDPGDFGNQFSQSVQVENNKKTKLVVNDQNAYPGNDKFHKKDYHYELRFLDGSKLDPIITNMGCCKSYSFSGAEAVGYSLLLVTAGALAAMGYRKWRAKRSSAAAGGVAGKASKGP